MDKLESLKYYKCSIMPSILIIFSQLHYNMHSRSKWTPEVDLQLKNLASGQNKKNWVQIAKDLSLRFKNDCWSGKQCRERYINHCLNETEEKQLTWNSEEIWLMFDLLRKYGPKWTKISSELQGKTENNVKNKFYSSLRKFVRKLNCTVKIHSEKYKKQMRYSSVLRAVEAFHSLALKNRIMIDKSKQINDLIITYMATGFEGVRSEELIQLVNQINRFNLETRSFKQRRFCFDQKKTQSKSTIHFSEEHNVENIRNGEEKNNEKCLNQQNCKTQEQMNDAPSQIENLNQQNTNLLELQISSYFPGLPKIETNYLLQDQLLNLDEIYEFPKKQSFNYMDELCSNLQSSNNSLF